MAAVLMTYEERDVCECCGSQEHGAKRTYAICRAGRVDLVNHLLAEGFDVGHDAAGHVVEVGALSLEEAGWTRDGRAWLCPEHSESP